MKKHELLEKAMKYYPKGTKFIPPFLKTEYTSTGIFRLDSQSDIEMMDEGIPILLIYTYSTVTKGTWAEIIPEKLERKFIMKSEDGFDLYEGDEQFVVNKDDANKYFLIPHCRKVMLGDEEQTWLKVFSTREAAIKWIEEQNKPNQIEVRLFTGGYALICKGDIEVYQNDSKIHIKPSDIEEIHHVLNSL